MSCSHLPGVVCSECRYGYAAGAEGTEGPLPSTVIYAVPCPHCAEKERVIERQSARLLVMDMRLIDQQAEIDRLEEIIRNTEDP